MKKTLSIALKELNAYFKSPTAYVVLIVSISVFNFFFFMIIDQNREASLRDMFKLMEFMFIFIAPILTMRSLAEEKRTGTIEFLKTCPLKSSTMVLGKYLGSFLFFLILIAITFIYYVIIEFFASPDRLTTFIGYFGIILEGALFLAIGTLISSLTQSQIIAAIGSYLILFILYFSITFVKFTSGKLYEFIQFISVWSHAENFYAGLFTLNDLTYYATGIILCLYLTYLAIERRT